MKHKLCASSSCEAFRERTDCRLFLIQKDRHTIFFCTKYFCRRKLHTNCIRASAGIVRAENRALTKRDIQLHVSVEVLCPSPSLLPSIACSVVFFHTVTLYKSENKCIIAHAVWLCSYMCRTTAEPLPTAMWCSTWLYCNCICGLAVTLTFFSPFTSFSARKHASCVDDMIGNSSDILSRHIYSFLHPWPRFTAGENY